MFIREITLDKAFYARRYIGVGYELALRVLNVNPENGFISLSKIRVNPKEAKNCKQKYINSKIVDGIIKLLAVKVNKPLLYLYQNIIIFMGLMLLKNQCQMVKKRKQKKCL